MSSKFVHQTEKTNVVEKKTNYPEKDTHVLIFLLLFVS